MPASPDTISQGREGRRPWVAWLLVLAVAAGLLIWRLSTRDDEPVAEPRPRVTTPSQPAVLDPAVVHDAEQVAPGHVPFTHLVAIDGGDVVLLSRSGEELGRRVLPGSGPVTDVVWSRADEAVVFARGDRAWYSTLRSAEQGEVAGGERVFPALTDDPASPDVWVLTTRGTRGRARLLDGPVSQPLGEWRLPAEFTPLAPATRAIIGAVGPDRQLAMYDALRGRQTLRYGRPGARLIGAVGRVVYWADPRCTAACGVHLTEGDGSDHAAFVDDDTFLRGVSGARAVAAEVERPNGSRRLAVVSANFSLARPVTGSSGFRADAGWFWYGSDHVVFADENRRVLVHQLGGATVGLPLPLPDGLRLVGACRCGG